MSIFQKEDEKRLKIMVTTAGTVPAKTKADYIITIAERAKADLIVLNVINKQDDYEDGQNALKIFHRKGSKFNVRPILRIGRLTETIVRTATDEEIDIILLGLDEQGNIGSAISRDVMQKTDIPVLLIPNI